MISDLEMKKGVFFHCKLAHTSYFKCNYCNKNFENATVLQNHREQTSIHCKYCTTCVSSMSSHDIEDWFQTPGGIKGMRLDDDETMFPEQKYC